MSLGESFFLAAGVVTFFVSLAIVYVLLSSNYRHRLRRRHMVLLFGVLTLTVLYTVAIVAAVFTPVGG